jgi:hypothetical protein
MISIYINNQLADYFGDITIKKDNPLFANFDIEPTEHTYTLTLPTTATNAKIFALIQYSLNKPQQLSARIEIDGVVVLEGSCNVQSWSESGYSVYFSGIAPNEDATPIKAMLGDTAMLSDIISFGSFQVDNSGYTGRVTDGIVVGLVNAYDSVGGTTLIQSNVAFSVGKLVDAIADHYGITIQMLDAFNDYSVVCAGKPIVRVEQFNGRPIFYMDVDKSIPRITAKAFLSSISSALGYKMRIDYKSGGVTFYSLDEVDNSSVFIEHSKYNVTFNADIPVVGVMNFAQYKPLEVDTDNGKEVYPYTDFENVEISKGSAKSENRISIMQMKNNGIIMPHNREEDADKELIALCQIYSTATYLLTINGYELPIYKLYEVVADRHTTIKFSARLNSIQFVTLNLWRALYLDYIGEVFVKSINYKSGGESDIEGYLY